MALLGLPNELLIRVFENLNPIIFPPSLAQNRDIPHFSFENERALSHVSLTPRLSKLAEPILYRTFFKEPSAPRDPAGAVHISRLRKFLHTLCSDKSSPRLAGHVRRIVIGEWDTTVQDSHLEPCFSSERSLWKEQATAFGTAIAPFVAGRHHARWKQKFSQGNQDVEIVLLLFLAPRLVELYISLAKLSVSSPTTIFTMLPDSLLPGAVERLLLPRFHGFEHLKRVIVTADVPPHPYHAATHRSTTFMAPPRRFLTLPLLAGEIIQAPHVKSLCAIGDYRAAMNGWVRSRGANIAMTSIDLRESMITATEIATLVANAIFLKTFELSFNCKATRRVPRFEHITWPQVVQALRSRGGTIRKLKLTSALHCFLVWGAHTAMSIVELDWRRVGSLTCFTAFEELTICETALLGSEMYSTLMKSVGDRWPECTLLNVLPTNLRLLRVLDCTWFTITHLQTLAASLAENRSQTSLQKISLKVLRKGQNSLTARPLLTNGGYVKRANGVRELFEALEKVGISCNLGISYGRNRSPDLVWLVKT